MIKQVCVFCASSRQVDIQYLKATELIAKNITTHIAFNEPEQEISEKGPRRVILNDYTITINAIRAQIGGNLENFPRYAYTIGMREILNSRKIRLYCRNGTLFDWANTILRIVLFGIPGDDYPVSYIRNHPNYTITTDKDTLSTPKNLT